MDSVKTTSEAKSSTSPAVLSAPRKRNFPLFKMVKQSRGWQRAMLLTGMTICTLFVFTALAAPILAPYGYAQTGDSAGSFGTQQPPSARNWLGTTVSGFDVLSRIIWGTQTALMVIIVAVVISSVVGVLLGLVSGYIGGWLDRVLVVIADAVYAFPSLLLAIVMSIVISGGQSSLIGGVLAASLSITVVFIPQYFRVIRSEVVRVKHEPYVEAAKVVGASHARIMGKHILRNSIRTLPVIITLNASEAILTLAGLGFLGFGIEPTKAAELGYDLNRAVADVTSGIWWTALFPGAVIVLIVLGVTLVGESLNDLADPRLRGRAAAAVSGGSQPVEIVTEINDNPDEDL
ncbi:ABC transporter permease [Actinomycetaceae bacterium TAE3-ERU4]|nr:ABC transporter permease [Actinomycetaceae bacterium TAE3-ERU4]